MENGKWNLEYDKQIGDCGIFSIMLCILKLTSKSFNIQNKAIIIMMLVCVFVFVLVITIDDDFSDELQKQWVDYKKYIA